jgi:low affinity Fe/Cu permease
MEHLKSKSERTLGRVAASATRWIGSTRSLVVHTVLFLLSFGLYFFGFDLDKILLVVTTVVSLEAIYLSIFIQMSVNKHAEDLDEVAHDVDEIQEDVDEIQEDVEEIQKDVDEIQEDVEDIQEEDESDQQKDDMTLVRIEQTLSLLMSEIAELKKQNENKSKS